MYFESRTSFVMVLVQFSCIAGLLISGKVIPQGYILKSISAAGILLGCWAVYTMQFSNLNIGPDPRADARFIRKGPYGILRHPMYAAILLCFVPLVISAPTILKLSLMLVLFTNLLIKIEYEEKMLCRNFENYESYREGTWKILPYVY